MLNRIVVNFLSFSLLLQAGHIIAGELEDAPSIFDQWRLYFYLGDYQAETTPDQLESPGSEFAFGIGGLFDYSEHVEWGFDAIAISRDYDTPDTISGGPFTVVSDDMSLSTLGLTATARLKYVTSIAELYAGGGAGLYMSILRISASTLGFIESHEERSNDFGYFYNCGMMFNISNENYLGVEYRDVFLEASFSPITTESVDVGGDMLLLTYMIEF